MIDTLKLARRLTEKGMDRQQAEALADELNEGLKDAAVTKADLAVALHKLKAELITWQVGIALALFGALKLIH